MEFVYLHFPCREFRTIMKSADGIGFGEVTLISLMIREVKDTFAA